MADFCLLLDFAPDADVNNLVPVLGTGVLT
jgi:hypothetical protein